MPPRKVDASLPLRNPCPYFGAGAGCVVHSCATAAPRGVVEW
jgi:hypothetical protein